MGKTEPVRKMAQPCHRCPPATPVGHQHRRGAPSRSSRGGEEDTPPDSLFTLWSVYNLFQCSTRCPSQQNLTCRCEILLASLTICFGRSNSTQKGQMICDYFFPTISLGTASQQINGIVGSVAMYAEYPLTIQDWILVYTSHPLSCSDTGECTGLFEIEATNGICQGCPLTTCPRSGFTEEVQPDTWSAAYCNSDCTNSGTVFGHLFLWLRGHGHFTALFQKNLKSIMKFAVVMIAGLPNRFLSLTTEPTNQLLSTSVMMLALRTVA
ncbi:uncharacterized protein [Triticum aestivum]|uniref:uncharacterized protein isoform X1 n=1 Tax=Triticum aestivum TaxID=4565 RepID=UPI001D009D03|nr:uncharacterized protein LOC123097336 isoform X1 [Triticum aestivum]XP_044374976.1 uncharacterized protein LOC123097336 isoform X1 [Triticum aestivum]XP_044374977.1 uncharacterized protein LOC123097336 isoform X1 [Triticum aestivum]XP_044374978.1 uncharacterized protein LOC123097336 isoform X1 [Triticum aestivum]XP_044374979.1 uncharacterized protein LOC123097336 isoform X1 [Triticum aestivum]XP_044374980.1 uncharacterized protein LOC123097336 isoform X1 [Triticum aestivum]XP_044374981.1 un